MCWFTIMGGAASVYLSSSVRIDEGTGWNVDQFKRCDCKIARNLCTRECVLHL